MGDDDDWNAATHSPYCDKFGDFWRAHEIARSSQAESVCVSSLQILFARQFPAVPSDGWDDGIPVKLPIRLALDLHIPQGFHSTPWSRIATAALPAIALAKRVVYSLLPVGRGADFKGSH
eukprot:24680-Prymnesium_polylepis.1